MPKICKTLVIAFAIMCSVISSFAQDGAYGSYSPYSVFGIGQRERQGTAYGKGMGGTGIANRDKRYVNYLNPASVTARDTLSFMLDFGLSSKNTVYRQGNIKSANNTFNISNIAFSFPIYKSLSAMFGVSPYSDVGYDFSNYSTDADYVLMQYTSGGNGGLYQIFGGLGINVFRHFSIGIQAQYVFGNIDKYSTLNFAGDSYKDIYNGYTIQMNAMKGKVGFQWEIPVRDAYLTIGATYSTEGKVKGYVSEYNYASISSIIDTLSNKTDTLAYMGNGVKLASEKGVGISLRKPEKWNIEVNYTRSDWRNSNFENVMGFANEGTSSFTTTFSESICAGFEFIPNRNDVRYYMRRCSYRVGAYYDREYYKLDGNSIKTYGLTLGMTLPILRLYNGLSFAVDIGQRGKNTGTMTRERYVSFSVGFNIHDIWFMKQRYD